MLQFDDQSEAPENNTDNDVSQSSDISASHTLRINYHRAKGSAFYGQKDTNLQEEVS